jgi:lipoprotein-releasing system ATP-binding protein
VISAENIKKSYGSLEVLRGVSLQIPKAKVASISGASGAGKSTLLHIIGTLDAPDQGEVKLNGINPFNLSKRELSSFRNKHIGFVFQFHHLLPEFSALENVCMPAFIAGMSRVDAISEAMQLIEFLGLEERAKHKPSELSGGEQQRIAVARALINRPSVLLADEPSGNLDYKNASELHKLFFKLRDERDQTIIVVTHNQELAAMADIRFHITDGLMDPQQEY